MKQSSKIREYSLLFQFIIYSSAVFAMIITLYPFIYVFSMSISSPENVLKGNVFLWPQGLSFDAYKVIFRNNEIWHALLNSVLYALIGTVFNVAMALLAGYPLSKPSLLGKNLINKFLIIPMYFGGGLIPSFVLINKLGLYNTFWVIIIPGMVSIWNIILVRTFIRGIPYSIQESALIDGANELQILWHIIIPVSTAIIAVISLYCLVGSWNSYFSSMIYQPNRALHPIQMFMRRVLLYGETTLTDKQKTVGMFPEQQRAGVMTQLKYAAIIFTNIPIIMSYPFLQKYFIKGVMIGSLKG